MEDAVKAREAGAAIAHIHVRLAKNGKPTADVALFKEVMAEIKSRCDLVLLPTTGGTNVRMGLEASLYAGRGKQATSSADQVRMVVNIAKELSLEPATPDEVRNILGLKGPAKVEF